MINYKKIKYLPFAQTGIALPVVLFFVVIMMLLGATVIRNVTLGEKMAGNTRSQELAFQAAEQALRYCESAMMTGSPVIATKTTASPNLWTIAGNWVSSSSVSTAVATAPPGVLTAPRCIVENMTSTTKLDPTQTQRDPNVFVYRITARGTGADDNAVVLLQSYLKFP